MELYKKLRPSDFSEMYGQEAAVKALTAMVNQNKIPHSIMFTGPSGTGKTTAARILKSKLECSDHDFMEMDAASNRGIDDIRKIRESVGLSPMAGKTRVWLIDESHKLTNDAQNALLKILEDTPKHVYFMLATTDPAKLLATIKTRCTQIAMKALSAKTMEKLLTDTMKKEKKKVSNEVLEKIIDLSFGSARQAMVLLESCLLLNDEESQLEIIKADAEKSKGIALALCLVGYRGAPKWSDVAKILREVEDEPETIRRIILSVCNNECLKVGSKFVERCTIIMNAMRDPFFDAGTAKAMLTLACRESI